MPTLRRTLAPLHLLVLLPLFACQPGGNDAGDELGDTGDASTSSSSESSGSESSSSVGETSVDTSATSTADTSDTTDTSASTSADTSSDTQTDTSSDTTTGGDGDAECASDAECVLVNDCCHCTAAPPNAIPPCDLPECFALTCDGMLGQIEPSAECRVGSCELGQVGCDLNQVFCDIPEPPPCEGGTVRAVVNNCYGPCVQPSMCETLPFECDAGTCGAGYACMNSQSGAPSKCVPLPPACGGVAGCDCIAPWLSEVCDATCGEANGTLICQDGG